LRAEQWRKENDEAVKFWKTYTLKNIDDLIPDLLADD
jgi:hypothetical protein